MKISRFPQLCSLALLTLLTGLSQPSRAELLVWWSFDEDAGSDTVIDRSGNENDGELMNFDFDEDSDLVPDGGKFGGAVHFDGNDDYVHNSTDFQPAGEAFTYAYFFKPDEDDYTDGHERDDHIYSNARPHFSFSRDDGGDGLLGMYYTMGGDTQTKSTTNEWSNDTWYHVAWTYDGEDVRIYIDGVEESSDPGGGEHTVQGDGRFNLGSNAGGNAYDGFMDDLIVLDEALSASDIMSIAQNGVKAFLDQRNVDSDGDDLPDLWENQIVDADAGDAIATVADVAPDADFDADGSNNGDEFKNGTDPVDPDTDDDGLKDGVETNTGTWTSADATGTDPRKPDTDQDGLPDGVENPDLPHNPNNASQQPGTNPNLADTDGDNWLDNTEIGQGTDPTDKNNFPDVGQRILFLGASDDPTSGADQTVMDFLTERYGDQNVDYMNSGQAQSGDELEYGALILSSTFGSGTARGKFHESTVAILNWEEALARDANGEFSMSQGRTKDTSEHSIIIKEEHPITNGFDVGATVQMTDGDAEFWWSTDEQAPGSVALAGDDDDEEFNLFLNVIEAGDELISGDPAPGKRVMLGITDSTFDFFTDDAKTLFGQAVDWLLGIGGSTSGPPFQITEVARTEEGVSLQWASKANKTYTIERSADLQDWLELSDGIESEGELTTFDDDTVPPDAEVFYFRIREEVQ